jgi:phospholipid/cholesterol/gamma-HCH transport system substrate-binding protein
MTMTAEARAKIAFAAFLLVLALATAAWWVIASHQFILYEIRSQDSVSGLIAGAPVEFHGVEVGKVQQVRLVDPRNVRVLLEVDKDAPVTTATVATITGRGLATRGFTGYVYVNLEDRGTAGRPLAALPGSRYPQIASAPAQEVNLDTSISQLNQSVQSVLALLQEVLDTQTVASLKQSARSLDQLTQTLAANNERLVAILANAEQASAKMPPLLQSGSDTVRTLQSELLPQARSTLAQLSTLSESTNDTVRTLQTQVLPDAQRTVNRLDQLAASLNESAARIRRNPSVLLRGATATPGPGEAP